MLHDGEESRRWRELWGRCLGVEKEEGNARGQRERLYKKRAEQEARGRRALLLLKRKGELLVRVWNKWRRGKEKRKEGVVIGEELVDRMWRAAMSMEQCEEGRQLIKEVIEGKGIEGEQRAERGRSPLGGRRHSLPFSQAGGASEEEAAVDTSAGVGFSGHAVHPRVPATSHDEFCTSSE